MAKAGLYVGCTVKLTRRISHKFGPRELRKDVPEGFQTSVKGTAGDKIFVRLTSIVGGKEFAADVAVKLDCVEKSVGDNP